MLDQNEIERIERYISGKADHNDVVFVQTLFSSGQENIGLRNHLEKDWESDLQITSPSEAELNRLLDHVHHVIRNKENQKRKLLIHRFSYVYSRIAAILLLPLVIAGGLFMAYSGKTSFKVESPVTSVIHAPVGARVSVNLPDGTVVFLNSGSSLKFPNSFDGQKTRNVELIGEGNFKVARNSQQPFIVDIRKLQIRVLGTTFNVNAYPDNSEFTIALVEGSINIQQELGKETKDLIKMKPNQVVAFNQSDNNLSWKTESELSKYTAWIEGKIVFANDPVHTVMQKLENWYNVDIELADKRLEKYRFTGTFIDEPLEQVLNILNLTSHMQYQIIAARKLEDNSYSKRKIILRSK
jgi:transmembrane sensor